VYLNRALNQIQYHTTTSVLARAAFQMVIRWIKAHAAWIYNKAADTAAKTGANSNRHCSSPPTPLDNLKMELKINKLKAWTNRWQTTNTARQSKFFLTGPNQKLTKQLLLLPKFNLS
jgi:hypothetical protein